MTDEKLARMQRKRELFRARLKRRAKGQFSDPVMVSLRQGGFTAARVSADEQMAIIHPFTRLPGIDEHVDWSRVPRHQCRVWTEENQRVDYLHEATRDLGLRAEDRVLVVFHTSFAGIRTSVAAVLANASVMLDSNPEIWICSAVGAEWLIEAAGRDICWGRVAQAFR